MAIGSSLGINTDEVGFVLQGPTVYVEPVVECYCKAKNVIWSTWDDEPEANFKIIKESGIKLNLVRKPVHTGYCNINLQCLSTYTGVLELAKDPEIKYFVKVRSDIVIDETTKFKEAVKNALAKDPIAFLGYIDHLGGYVLDYIVAGALTPMLNFWSPELRSDSGYPSAEIWLQNRAFPQLREANAIEMFNHHFPFIKLQGCKFYSLKWQIYLNKLIETDKRYVMKE